MNPVHTLHPIPLSLIILSYHLFLGLPTGLFLPFRFFDQNFLCVSHLSNACYMSIAPLTKWPLDLLCFVTSLHEVPFLLNVRISKNPEAWYVQTFSFKLSQNLLL